MNSSTGVGRVGAREHGVTSRRAFVKQIAGGAAAASIARNLWASGSESSRPEDAKPASQAGKVAPVVTIHLDQPYLDATGRGIPYRPPSGLKSAEPVAHLSEYAFRCTMPYV